jgi:hypothetical protein
MAVTYTTAAARDRARVRPRSVSVVDPLELAIGAASLFALLLAFLTYAGVVTAARLSGTPSIAPLNVNTIGSAADLEPAMERVFPAAPDRRLAARELFAFLQRDTERRVLQDVRTLGRAHRWRFGRAWTTNERARKRPGGPRRPPFRS